MIHPPIESTLSKTVKDHCIQHRLKIRLPYPEQDLGGQMSDGNTHSIEEIINQESDKIIQEHMATICEPTTFIEKINH